MHNATPARGFSVRKTAFALFAVMLALTGVACSSESPNDEKVGEIQNAFGGCSHQQGDPTCCKAACNCHPDGSWDGCCFDGQCSAPQPPPSGPSGPTMGGGDGLFCAYRMSDPTQCCRAACVCTGPGTWDGCCFPGQC